MISTNQLKNGNHIEVDGTVFKVLEFQHVNPGKGAAFVRTKLRRASDGAVIDQVEVKRVKDLSPREIEHDNPEFRRVDEMVHFLEQIYGRKVEPDDTVTVVRFSAIVDKPVGMTEAIKGFGGAQN